MATYYWVGGAGTWDSTTTTNWAIASGGPGGGGVPTALDTATFNGNSGTGAVIITASATCVTCNFGAPSITATLNADSISKITNLTITAGTFDCSTFNLTMGSSNITHTGGTFTCNGGTIVMGGIASSGTASRTINLNASTLNLSNSTPINFSGTGLSFNAGTSQINLIAAWSNFVGNGATFYNVSSTNTVTVTSTAAMSGINTFNNLSFTAKSTPGITVVTLANGITVNGTLTMPTAATIGSTRFSIRSATIGTFVQITAAAVSLTDTDFRDITGAGAATWTGTRLGDCGGNTNITFPASKTVYWNLAGNQNYSSAGWATTQTGIPSVANFPLAQDTAIFTDTNPASAGSVTLNAAYNVGTLNFASRTTALNFAASLGAFIYGDVTLSSTITLSGAGAWFIIGRNKTQTITSAGRTFSQGITQQTVGGTLAFADAFITSGVYTHSNGALSTNYNLSCITFSSSNTNVRSISFGSGQLYCTGTGTVFTTATATSLTITGILNVNVTSSGATAISTQSGAVLGTSNKISFNYTSGTYALTIGGTYCNDISFSGFAGSVTTASLGMLIYGNFFVGGSVTFTAGSATFMEFRGTSGTQTINTNGIALNRPVAFNGVGGTFQLQSNFVNANAMQLTNGTLDLNGFTMTSTTWSLTTGTKNLTFNGGSLVLTGSGTVTPSMIVSGFTSTAGAGIGTISLTNAAAKTFTGAGATYNCNLNQGGTGALTITGANTFRDITNTIQPTTVTLPASTTTTLTSGFSLSGTAGNLVTINSSTVGTRATLSLASGTVSTSYCSIIDSNATGGATWNAFTSNGNVDAGNNAGWNFLGGSTYSVALTETITGTDAVAATIGVSSDLLETLSASDVQDAINNIFIGQLTETGAVLDAQSVTINFSATVSETVSATDAQTSINSGTSTITESVTSTANQSAVGLLSTIQNETASATDSETYVLIPIGNANIVEASTAIDGQASAVNVNSGITETASATDTEAALINLSSAVSESVVSTATQTSLVSLLSTLTETVTAANTQTSSITYVSTIQETLSVVDAQVAVLNIIAAVAETVTATSTQASSFDVLVNIAETVVADGTQNTILQAVADLAELVVAVDTVQSNSLYTLTIVEGLVASDSITARLLWELINDIQSANWVQISNTQSPFWQEINTTQSPNWQNI